MTYKLNLKERKKALNLGSTIRQEEENFMRERFSYLEQFALLNVHIIGNPDSSESMLGENFDIISFNNSFSIYPSLDFESVKISGERLLIDRTKKPIIYSLISGDHIYQFEYLKSYECKDISVVKSTISSLLSGLEKRKDLDNLSEIQRFLQDCFDYISSLPK